MSDKMLHDDELDAVAGGTFIVLAKVATTAYATTVLSQKTNTLSTNPTFKDPQADYMAASKAVLSKVRGHP